MNSTAPLTLQLQQNALQTLLLHGDPEGTPPPWLQAGSRPEVYHHAYRSRLMGALRDNFSVLHRALGDEGFEALALAFIEAQPSKQPSIRWFGAHLADFMRTREDLTPHPALVDIARLDWALRGAFDAADAPALTLAELQALPPEAWPALQFALHPSVQLLDLPWAVGPAWQHLNETDPEQDEATLPEPEALDHTLLVWRQGLAPRWRSLDATEAALLKALQAGQNFSALSAVAAGLADNEADATHTVVRCLGQWLSDGLLRH